MLQNMANETQEVAFTQFSFKKCPTLVPDSSKIELLGRLITVMKRESALWTGPTARDTLATKEGDGSFFRPVSPNLCGTRAAETPRAFHVLSAEHAFYKRPLADTANVWGLERMAPKTT